MEFDSIDWDSGNWPKCGKHGLSRAEIEAFLREGTTRIFRDVDHSGTEERFMAIGRDMLGHSGVFVGFTIRRTNGLRLVRPVTARYMHAKEIARYDHRPQE